MSTNVIFYKKARNKKIEYEMNGIKLKNVQCVKVLDITIALSFKSSQQCKDAAGKANRVLGFINRSFSFKNEDIGNTSTSYQLSRTLSKTCSVLVPSPYKRYSKTRDFPAKGYEGGYVFA